MKSSLYFYFNAIRAWIANSSSHIEVLSVTPSCVINQIACGSPHNLWMPYIPCKRGQAQLAQRDHCSTLISKVISWDPSEKIILKGRIWTKGRRVSKFWKSPTTYTKQCLGISTSNISHGYRKLSLFCRVNKIKLFLFHEKREINLGNDPSIS